MSSFTIYDPKTKGFRTLETTSEADLPFEQVLLINILIELRVISEYLSDPPVEPTEIPIEDVEDRRAAIVHEI